MHHPDCGDDALVDKLRAAIRMMRRENPDLKAADLTDAECRDLAALALAEDVAAIAQRHRGRARSAYRAIARYS